ncbi:MAG: hypothetical protein FWG40_00710 [Peptococcaceae bacterium]|nr:hypothetical protein [Peptococcaceae bacterium]
MKKPKNVSILGTKYEIKHLDVVVHEDAVCFGLIDPDEKTITIQEGLDEKEREAAITHEIIHGYLIESGLPRYYNDELLVEWLTRMIRAIVKTAAVAIGEGD